MSTENKQETIDVFDGWESPDDNNLLSEVLGEETDNETTKVVKQVLNDKVDNITTTNDDEPSEEEQEAAKKLADETFSEWDDDENETPKPKSETGDEEEEEEEQLGKTSSTISTLNFLKEKGLLNFELEENEELTDELAEELLEDSYDSAIESRMEERLKDLPDSVKNLVKYSLNNGNPDELIAKMASQPSNPITKDLDLTVESNMERVVRLARKEKGEDDETIDSYLDYLKDSGKLESIAKKEFDGIIQRKQNFLQQEADAQAQRRDAAKQKQRAFKKDLSDFISNEELEIKLTRKEKQEIPSYIADPTVELKNGNKISQLQSDLFEALNDKEKVLKLAKMLRSNFDFSEFIQDEKTKNIKKLQGTVRKGNRINRSSQPKERKSLADMLD